MEGTTSPAKRRIERRKLQGQVKDDFHLKLDLERSINPETYYNFSLDESEIEYYLNQYVNINRNIEIEFYKRTKLNPKDLSFLLLATALQCVRQYFFTDFKDRVHHEETKKSDNKIEEKVSDMFGEGKDGIAKQGGYYYRKLDSIILEGVPYDPMVGGKKFNLSMGGTNHRYKTLGHDPILGWVIGPMNIITDTLTMYNFSSYHIRSASISSNANNSKILDASVTRINKEPLAVVASVIKQAIHFNSDLYTKHSLPIPIVQTFSPELAENLAAYGIDSANVLNVGKQATYSILINSIISIIHGLFQKFDKEDNIKLYQVKTKKIILYSNTLATVSNLIYVAITNNLKKMDIGGAIVTIYRIVKDEKFIRDVMQEFIDTEVSKYYSEEFDKISFEHNKLLSELGYENPF